MFGEQNFLVRLLQGESASLCGWFWTQQNQEALHPTNIEMSTFAHEEDVRSGERSSFLTIDDKWAPHLFRERSPFHPLFLSDAEPMRCLSSVARLIHGQFFARFIWLETSKYSSFTWVGVHRWRTPADLFPCSKPLAAYSLMQYITGVISYFDI